MTKESVVLRHDVRLKGTMDGRPHQLADLGVGWVAVRQASVVVFHVRGVRSAVPPPEARVLASWAPGECLHCGGVVVEYHQETTSTCEPHWRTQQGHQWRHGHILFCCAWYLISNVEARNFAISLSNCAINSPLPGFFKDYSEVGKR
jgi:hypothetical protein